MLFNNDNMWKFSSVEFWCDVSKTLSELYRYFAGPICFVNSIDNLIASSSQEYMGQRNAVVKGI